MVENASHQPRWVRAPNILVLRGNQRTQFDKVAFFVHPSFPFNCPNWRNTFEKKIGSEALNLLCDFFKGYTPPPAQPAIYIMETKDECGTGVGTLDIGDNAE